MPDNTNIEPDSDLPMGSDPTHGVGDAEPSSDVPGEGPGDRDDAGPRATAPVPLTETFRRVELVETTTQNLLPDGREETTRSTRIDETVRRTAVPHQAPGSAYPAPVG